MVRVSATKNPVAPASGHLPDAAATVSPALAAVTKDRHRHRFAGHPGFDASESSCQAGILGGGCGGIGGRDSDGSAQPDDLLGGLLRRPTDTR